MAIQYNIAPLEAMKLFYDGEKRGVWNGDFIKNEKKRGLVLPPMLREFLENYAYLGINEGGDGAFKLFHPDGIGGVLLSDDEEGDIHLLVIGALNELWVAVRMDECDYLRIVFGEKSDDVNRMLTQLPQERGTEAAQPRATGGTIWTPTENGTLEGIFTVMLCSQLFKSADSFVFENEIEIDAVLKKHGADRSKILPSDGNVQHISLCFDTESGAFLAVEFDGDGNITMLHVVPRKTFEQRKAEKYATVSLEELNVLFDGEFYGNALHCDFDHALEIQLEIVKRLERSGADDSELYEHYRLAGRCCWSLKRPDEALEWYDKTGEIVERLGDPEKRAEYYHTLANFYADNGQFEKSDEFYDKELDIFREISPDNVYKIGMNYLSRAQFLDGALGDPERVIELCNLALEQFQQNPHDSGCKYEIARTQQLRGGAKRRKKELDKQKNAE